MPRPQLRTREQERAWGATDRARHGEHIRAYHRAYYHKNKAVLLARRNTPEQKQRLRDYLRERTFGVTPEQYRAWVNEQEGKCAICRQAPGIRGLAVDHDHNTGKIRGLLCGNCNVLLGHAKDNPATLRAAAEYLETR